MYEEFDPCGKKASITAWTLSVGILRSSSILVVAVHGPSYACYNG